MLIEDGLDRVELDDSRAQHLIEHGDELQQRFKNLLEELSVSDRYANEEVRSTWAYPSEYAEPQPIGDQIKAQAEIWELDPSAALAFARNLGELPDGAEGFFAIPSIDAVAARHFHEVKDPAEHYCRAVNLVLEKVGSSRKFYNYCAGKITPNRLRVHARTAHALDLIAEQQKSDILTVAGQFGLRHRGRSVRRAREVFLANEFGFGAFAVGCMTLTHPKRFVRWEQLHTDCGGDEFSPDADGDFSRAPYFFFCGSGVKFRAYSVGNASECSGSASGFLPQ